MDQERERDDAENVLQSSIFYDKDGNVVMVGKLVGAESTPVVTVREGSPEQSETE